ncbi:uncharacterized protein (DUF849 family) [Rhizobium sp. ERR 922]|uniref:3-keto-5-aminohexanoate cleavage protein n=1 Tax=unclassified Rhizobium TaxID=2613769 RepID=UPI0011A1B265|nr:MULTISPECIES: 3-keto-5-aminohexanoate cleavage protein [unclassified Rhizobium]TWB45535.1 uncharacterized protein (DUF849 family) [Rhizobium sp. ERR 922]TWB88230.1 uncharacterized protein (DUF849 family) [Rhizobium sp. ERR 942]
MIVQACINGARPKDYHPTLPMTAAAIASDCAACVDAGAGELHIHPRSNDGRESLLAVDDTMVAVRQSCPGTLVGVSTGAWIEGDETRTKEFISRWNVFPDYASVNLSEADAPAVMELLDRMGVGIEAGLATVADAERFISLPNCNQVFRILVEIEEQNSEKANAIADGIETVLRRANLLRPVLLHGFDATVWHFVSRARKSRLSTRVGLEDGRLLRNGNSASGNEELVRDAIDIFTSG